MCRGSSHKLVQAPSAARRIPLRTQPCPPKVCDMMQALKVREAGFVCGTQAPQVGYAYLKLFATQTLFMIFIQSVNLSCDG